MYRNRINNLTQTPSIDGVYGNTKAASFIKDAIDGVQSLDIVVFGDSNSGSGASCGYTRGWWQSLSSFGAPVYATPMMLLASEDGANVRLSGMFMPSNYFNWNGRLTTGATGTSYTLSARCRDGISSAIELNNTLGNYFVREGQAAASTSTSITLDAGASAVNDFYKDCFISILTGSNGTVTTNWGQITAYNGTTKVASVVFATTPASNAHFLITKFLLKPSAFTFGVVFIDPAATYTSSGGGPSVRTAKGNQLTAGNGSGSTNCQYRLVYGKFTTSGGTFRLRSMKNVNDPITVDSTNRSTTGTSGYDVAKLSFTSSTTSSVPDEIKCAWDGYNNGNAATYTTGPFAAFWHSIIRLNKKGYCVHNLNYLGGSTTTQHALIISRMEQYLEMYLKELRERQIEAGGSGRVLWFFNSGINGPDTSTSWTNSMTTIVNTIYSTWIALGYPKDDLAFIASVTHPTTNGDPGAGSWATTRDSVSNAANLWALTDNAYEKNVCVFDIQSVFTSAQLKERNLYQILSNNQYQTHLQEGPTQGGVSAAEWKWNGPDATVSSNLYNGYILDPVTTNNGYVAVITGLLRKLLQIT
jgi:hypothetical protein